MSNVLVVCSSPKGAGFYSQILKDSGFYDLQFVESGSAARRLFIDNDYELVLIHARLKDEAGFELAQAAAEKTSAGVVLVARAELADAMARQVEDYGVIVAEWPLNRFLFHQALKIAAASRRRVYELKRKNITLQRQLEEAKLIDRAKCALIQVLHMTEPQAHRYIEKQAMDRRVTKREVAAAIIEMYE